jgi:Xaa-Pro aminopeptidase
VYEWVLRAQAAAIDAIRPGATYAQVHQAALEVLVEGLRDLKVLRGRPSELLETGAYRPWFMHRIGHWLGLDVHDVGPYFVDGASIPLQAGMVMTVEPGLYFPDRPDTPKALRGIGVRIEDDVLVTPRGRQVLTDGLPKTVEDIEKALSRPGAWWGEVRPLSRDS